jgi:hypothetical protein
MRISDVAHLISALKASLPRYGLIVLRVSGIPPAFRRRPRTFDVGGQWMRRVEQWDGAARVVAAARSKLVNMGSA